MRVLRFALLAVIAATLGGVLVAAQQAPLPPQPSAPAPAAVPPAMVSLQEIAAGLPADGSRWLHFGGNYSKQRHSPLTQITPENVNRLAPQWTFQTGTLGTFETTPLVATACST